MRKMIRAAVVSAVLAAFVLPGAAATRSEVRKTVEMSMLVTGHVEIEPDGSVSRYELDHPEKLPEPVKRNIDRVVPAWRFEPIVVGGKPVPARTRMGLRMRATPDGSDQYTLRIAAASFGSGKSVPGEDIEAVSMGAPRFPEAAWKAGYKGTVYLLLKIDRQGRVTEAAAEQVNMTVYGSSPEMERGRSLLANASTRVAKQWTFKVPTRGAAADLPYWTVRVPVDYEHSDDRAPRYGTWVAYVPGPRSKPDWAGSGEKDGGPEALVAGGVYRMGQGPKLLTSLSES